MRGPDTSTIDYSTLLGVNNYTLCLYQYKSEVEADKSACRDDNHEIADRLLVAEAPVQIKGLCQILKKMD